MKQTMKGFVAGFVVCALLSSTVAFAAGGLMKETFYGINVVVDGKAMQFTDDMRPFIMDGRTFLSLRAIGEALGKTVEWNGITSTAYIGPKPGADLYLPDVVPAYEVSSAEEYSALKSGGKDSVKMAGVEYTNALLIHTKGGNLLYNLNGKYTQLSGIIGHRDGGYLSDKSTTICSVEIWCDGVLRKKFDLTGDAYPEEFTVDLRGVLQLKISAIAIQGYSGNTVIANPVIR